MIVEEAGKFYNIDEETGLVTEAGSSDDFHSLDDEYRVGDRVEVAGAVGSVVSIIPSVYGAAFGVRFDDGDVEEFVESQLKRSSVEKDAAYENTVEEVLARYAIYVDLPHFTNDEITKKEEEAKFLNSRAKNVAANSKLSLGDQNKLGQVILLTGSDLEELQELRENSEESKKYISSFNRYKISSEVKGYGASLGMREGDISWLEDATEGLEVTETTDTDLAARATEVVAALNRDQLEDDAFLSQVLSYQREYLQIEDPASELGKKFASYLMRARADRLKELPAEAKTASTEDDLDDFDASALYL